MNYELINSNRNNFSWIAFLIATVALIVGIFSINDTSMGIYIYFPYVTIFFGVVTLFFFRVYKRMTWVSMITIVFMILRYVVTLITLHQEGYPKGIYNITVDNSRSLITALLMIYEIIMIYSALYIGQKKYNDTITMDEYKKKLFGKKNFAQLNVLIVLMIIITVIIFMMYPSLFNNYSFIINGNLENLTDIIIESQAGLPSGLRWIGYTLGEATRYIVLEYLLLKLYKKYSEKGFIYSRYWWLSIALSILNAVITSQRMMIGIFMSLTFFYQIYQLYPSKRRLFVLLGGVIGILSVSIITLTYWMNALSYQSFSQMIQGYTNGFYNVYQATAAYDNTSINLFEKTKMFFIGDGLGNVNVVSMFINGINSSDIYNFYIYGTSFNGGAVMPLVSQMSYYFTTFLGPIFSFISILWAKKLENRSLISNGNVMIGQFCAFVFAATPFMYNYSTVIHILTIVALPLLFCVYINSKTVVVGKMKNI